MSADMPRRRLRLVATVDADNLDQLAQALEQIGRDLITDDREDRQVMSGGYHSSHHYTMTCDEDQTGDRFRAQLSEWSQQQKVERLRGLQSGAAIASEPDTAMNPQVSEGEEQPTSDRATRDPIGDGLTTQTIRQLTAWDMPILADHVARLAGREVVPDGS